MHDNLFLKSSNNKKSYKVMTISICRLTGTIQKLFIAITLCTETVILSETELVPKTAYLTSFNLLYHLSISACISYKKYRCHL